MGFAFFFSGLEGKYGVFFFSFSTISLTILRIRAPCCIPLALRLDTRSPVAVLFF